MRVNGLTLVEATHEEVVNLIKLRKTLTLTLKGEELLQVISLTTKDHINVVASKNEGCIAIDHVTTMLYVCIIYIPMLGCMCIAV